ncbi:mitochondrial intermembrane space import and assembly protein 40 [Halyomorpha halys]|uniref:mitochondrial intermembrane space import and assembly protein 40 n=1 Tax=Halyomorpha halys TaxID=286706 RepID=UPI0006D4C761|nr:mitochondrial intermembrane space import and assembly protein 40 [Halyomorpha halys]
MSQCQEIGKDKIILATQEELSQPSKVELPEDDPQPGLILEDGTINWNCPCLGGMATGPCGVPFREAFSCFHYSTAEPKGSDCVEAFTNMQACMQKYPALYGSNDDDDESKDILNPDPIKNESPPENKS